MTVKLGRPWQNCGWDKVGTPLLAFLSMFCILLTPLSGAAVTCSLTHTLGACRFVLWKPKMMRAARGGQGRTRVWAYVCAHICVCLCMHACASACVLVSVRMCVSGSLCVCVWTPTKSSDHLWAVAHVQCFFYFSLKINLSLYPCWPFITPVMPVVK